MEKVVICRRYALMIAGFVCCLAGASLAFAEGGGYEGLIAPPPAPDSSAPSRAAADADEPPGYSGVISGPAGTDAAAKEPAPPPDPGGTMTPKSSDDLRLLALAHGSGADDDFTGNIKISDAAARRLAKPRTRIENMLPAEYAAKKSIDRVMPGVTDQKIPAEDRAENAGKARERLAALAEGLRYKTTIPDKAYRQAGLSDVFIAEEKEGAEKALSRLNLALKELEKY